MHSLQLKRRLGILISNPYVVFKYFNYTKIQRLFPDDLFMRIMMRAKVGYKLNLKSPETFNEKMQWLKLHDRNPIYSRMVDKYEAKIIIAEKIGNTYTVPSYGVWDSFDEIDFDNLPSSFVLKTTHDCGGIVICIDKKNFDYKSAKADLDKRLKTNFYWQGREWPYRNVKPRILAEKYLDISYNEYHFTYEKGYTPSITDYKLMCFNGTPFCCLVCLGRNSKEGLHENFYDMEWNLLPVKRSSPQYRGKVEMPVHFDEMKRISRILSKGIRFLRVDFFENNGNLYVGELTFYPASGFGPFIPEKWDYKLGELIDLGMR